MSGGSDTLDKIRAALIANNIGQVNSANPWPIFVGYMQDGPPVNDQAICLYETPGGVPLEAWAIVYPSVQVVVRGAPSGYTEARQKIQDIFTLLHGLDGALSDQFVYFYAKQSAPISMGQDERKRPSMAWNFRSERNTPT